MPEPILSPTFVFRFAVPVLQTDVTWKSGGIELGKEHSLPTFQELDGEKKFADFRCGWSAKGLFFDVLVVGKLQQPWCRETRLEDSDHVQIWVDTRDTKNIHRASRFCHRFLLMPAGAGPTQDAAISTMLKINRAREESRTLNAERIPVASRRIEHGYRLSAFLPAAALSGYDPSEQSRLGFTYSISDRELGWQCFSVGPGFPFAEDPSLWGTLELQS
jgi:hypothetical protein